MPINLFNVQVYIVNIINIIIVNIINITS